MIDGHDGALDPINEPEVGEGLSVDQTPRGAVFLGPLFLEIETTDAQFVTGHRRIPSDPDGQDSQSTASEMAGDDGRAALDNVPEAQDGAGDSGGHDGHDGSVLFGEAGDDNMRRRLSEAYLPFVPQLEAAQAAYHETRVATDEGHTPPGFLGYYENVATGREALFTVSNPSDGTPHIVGFRDYYRPGLTSDEYHEGSEAEEAAVAHDRLILGIARDKALFRAAAITGEQRDKVEHADAYSGNYDLPTAVRNNMPRNRLGDLSATEKGRLGPDSLQAIVDTLDTMVVYGVIPDNSDFGGNTVVLTQTPEITIGFVNHYPLEDLAGEEGTSIRFYSLEAFLGVLEALARPSSDEEQNMGAWQTGAGLFREGTQVLNECGQFFEVVRERQYVVEGGHQLTAPPDLPFFQEEYSATEGIVRVSDGELDMVHRASLSLFQELRALYPFHDMDEPGSSQTVVIARDSRVVTIQVSEDTDGRLIDGSIVIPWDGSERITEYRVDFGAEQRVVRNEPIVTDGPEYRQQRASDEVDPDRVILGLGGRSECDFVIGMKEFAGLTDYLLGDNLHILEGKALDAALEKNYADTFSITVPLLEQEISELDRPEDHPYFIGRGGDSSMPGVAAFRVGPNGDPENRIYVVRILSEGELAYQYDEAERIRHDALLVGTKLAPETRDSVEQIVAYDSVRSRAITRYDGVPLDEVLPSEWAIIASPETFSQLHAAVADMYGRNIGADPSVTNILWNREKQRLLLIDYVGASTPDVTEGQPDPGQAATVTTNDFNRLVEEVSFACPDESLGVRILMQDRYGSATLPANNIRGVVDEVARDAYVDRVVSTNMPELSITQGTGNDSRTVPISVNMQEVVEVMAGTIAGATYGQDATTLGELERAALDGITQEMTSEVLVREIDGRVIPLTNVIHHLRARFGAADYTSLVYSALLHGIEIGGGANAPAEAPVLTQNESLQLFLAAVGLNRERAAKVTGRLPAAVQIHLDSAMRKLQAESMPQAILHAFVCGYFTPLPPEV